MDEERSEAIAAAQEEAFQKFVTLGHQRYFSAPMTSNFYVQGLSSGLVVLILGSAGAITDMEQNIVPVADVTGAFTVEVSMLKNLANTINKLFPDDPPASGDGVDA